MIYAKSKEDNNVLQQEQIELIKSKLPIIEKCVNFAKEYLVLPTIQIYFDDCPSKRFPTMNNAAESSLDRNGIGTITLNGPWFAERIDFHQDDVEYFVFHELRHIHQQNQIRELHIGGQVRDSIERVKEWEKGFNNYIRNEGGDSQIKNIRQEVEIDATAYGILLEMLFRDGKQPLLSAPLELLDLADERLQTYIDTLPEFSKYRPKQTNVSQFVSKKKKIGRNEPCPCGSGKKYKKCCGK